MEILHVKNRALNKEENLALLRDSKIGRIGTINTDGSAYITPVNYVFEPESKSIYIHHSNRGGRLLENLPGTYRASFEIEQAGEIVNIGADSGICDADQVYRSVICYGKWEIAGDEEKIRGLRLLGEKYTGKPHTMNSVLEKAKLDRLVVLVIRIETMTGKCREPEIHAKP